MEKQVPRTALVTGASRGLGAAIALELAAAGMTVAVNYFADEAAARRVCSEIQAAGGQATPFRADVRDQTEVTAVIQQIEASLGPVDVLVLNATGPQPQLSIEDQTWAAYLDQLEFFVKSPLLLVKAVIGSMKARGFGRIINIGSEVFELGNPRFANYVSAKGAQLGLTRSWANELAPSDITVNLVAPGWIATDRDSSATDEARQAYIAGVPMLRRGAPHDIGAMVAFLASDEARFITGQKFSVNGGNTLA
jgi:3-oxoacyl-[acyl-carrier protein] reductase